MLSRNSNVEGDITEQKADAIVNAAKTELRGGGGVDGAIHQAAGPEILAACKKISGCPTGALDHPHRRAGMAAGSDDEDFLLASCYHHSLERAEENAARNIAFPAISTASTAFPLPARRTSR
jgi:O-acetyl-ADP-ribose deacetylase